MSFRYERDDARRLVMVTFQGHYQTSEGLTILKRLRQEGVAGYGVLYDCRQMSGRPTVPELRLLMSEEAPTAPNGRRRGPVAILATDPGIYDMACVYASLGKPLLTIEVFSKLKDAAQWLETRTVKDPVRTAGPTT